jgi:hypothetical protein
MKKPIFYISCVLLFYPSFDFDFGSGSELSFSLVIFGSLFSISGPWGEGTPKSFSLPPVRSGAIPVYCAARRFPVAGFGFLVTAVSEFACRCAELVLLSRSGCALTPKIGFAAGFLLRFLLHKSTAPVDLFSLLASQGPVILLGFCAAVVVLPPPYSSADFIFVFLCWVLVQGLCSSGLRQSLSPSQAGRSCAARNHFCAPWWLPPFSSCRCLIFLPRSLPRSPFGLVREECWACRSRVKV